MNKKEAFFFFLVVLLLLISLSQAQEMKIKVSAHKAELRLEPDPSSPVISVVSSGFIIQFIRKTDGWYFVELPPNKEGYVIAGYIHQSAVEDTKEEAPIVRRESYTKPKQKADSQKQMLPSDDWKRNVDVLAQLYFGDNYKIGKKKIVKKPDLEKQIIGQRVHWTMQFQADVIYRVSDNKSPWEIMGHNMALEAPFGPGDDWKDMKGLVWVMSASRQEGGQTIDWTEMVWGIPPKSDVIVDMRVKSIIGASIGKNVPCLWVDGEDLYIEYDGPRCDWPPYSKKIQPDYTAFTYQNKNQFKVEVENSNPWSVKVGLRGKEKGIDFIAPPGQMGFTIAPPGEYEIYFQHEIDPESLYKGDRFTLKDKGVRITLQKQRGGNFNVRKIK